MRRLGWRGRLGLFLLTVLCWFSAGAQGVAAQTVGEGGVGGELGNIDWRVSVSSTSDAGVFEVVFSADIAPDWHLYDLGPYRVPGLATEFSFDDSPVAASPAEPAAPTPFELLGPPRQLDQPTRRMDPFFGFEVGSFTGSARFAQLVRVPAAKTASDTTLSGEVEYQICRDEVGCVRGAWEFRVALLDGASFAATDPTNATNTASPPNAPNTASLPSSSGLWGLLLGAVLWGFAALLTPCVFPMVPMTVSFFMKQPHGRSRALLFGALIIALYTLPIGAIILATYLAGGEAVTADIFNWLATHWIPNVLFFIVFLLFAASLLGAFEFRMPSRLVNRSDRGVEQGGLAGIFFLALTLVLVSFSCTGPIVGTVLISSTRGEFWLPVVTMLFFSAAFALPFTLLALFPRWLERLPKSGGWLNSVKVVLGLVEIALGLKFLSVADQTYHWGILPREVYLSVWIVVGALLGFYLLGKLRFKYDSPSDHIGVGRLFCAIVVFSFTVWLVPGLFGAPLSAISGYLPPPSSHSTVAPAPVATPPAAASETIKHSDILSLPHGLSGYFDLSQGLSAARREGKPVLLDFTGHGCVNCREMEARVWSDPRVLALLREKFVIVALYSDDRTQLPENEWLTTPSGRTLRTLGRVNSYIVNTRYGISSQPAYLILDSEGTPLVPARGYDLDIEAFIDFLNSYE